MFGDEVELNAQVEVLNGYSAHGDRAQLRQWLGEVRSGGVSSGRGSPRVHLVHGEPPAQDAFIATLQGDGFTVDAPAQGEHRPL